jgi:hypothetical protein
MLSQLGFSAYFAFFETAFLHWLHFILVLLNWIGTFSVFVPLHQKINTGEFASIDLIKLEKKNWYRLILWLLTFILTLIQIQYYN